MAECRAEEFFLKADGGKEGYTVIFNYLNIDFTQKNLRNRFGWIRIRSFIRLLRRKKKRRLFQSFGWRFRYSRCWYWYRPLVNNLK